MLTNQIYSYTLDTYTSRPSLRTDPFCTNRSFYSRNEGNNEGHAWAGLSIQFSPRYLRHHIQNQPLSFLSPQYRTRQRCSQFTRFIITHFLNPVIELLPKFHIPQRVFVCRYPSILIDVGVHDSKFFLFVQHDLGVVVPAIMLCGSLNSSRF